MILVQSRGRLCREHLFVAPPSPVALFSSSPPSESEFSEQFDRPPGLKSPTAATNVPKYFKDDLERIFKAILKASAFAPTPALAHAPAPAPASAFVPALADSEKSGEQPQKACLPNIYCEKSYMNCYNFCQ